jgi:L-ascorbate metabolism protein UlaG (beta-lactamase superfamily)
VYGKKKHKHQGRKNMYYKQKSNTIFSYSTFRNIAKCARQSAGYLLLMAGIIGGASSGAYAQSKSWTFTENNNNVIKAQRDGGDAESSGEVKLDFFGHMAFRIISPRGTSVMIDPWRNDPSGYWGVWFPNEFPEVPVDIVLSTHAHFDHDAVYRPHANMVLERLGGDFSLGDVKITGLADKHMCAAKGWYKWTDAQTEFGQSFCPPKNYMHMDNSIQVVKTGGLKIAHWGDNRPVPSDHVLEKLKNVDVLILTIDGSQHILSYDDIAKAISTINPKIVIPAHYYTKGASSVLTTLSDAAEWVSQQDNVVKLDNSRLILKADEIKKMTGPTVYYFGANFATE